MAHTSGPELFTRLGRLHPQGFHTASGSSSGHDRGNSLPCLPSPSREPHPANLPSFFEAAGLPSLEWVAAKTPSFRTYTEVVPAPPGWNIQFTSMFNFCFKLCSRTSPTSIPTPVRSGRKNEFVSGAGENDRVF